ncbi:hypothetical protein [Kribbia dieselivorans]|uniref:hypothetical protein n=1 Tax=Kribbia dieselivorans TaxID=331526 RepID=UPI0012ED328B|nr:hypothetical protein [Kribbia dieselivorans]
MPADDVEAEEETHFWLSQPHIQEDLAESAQSEASGGGVGEDELRASLGLPAKRP